MDGFDHPTEPGFVRGPSVFQTGPRFSSILSPEQCSFSGVSVLAGAPAPRTYQRLAQALFRESLDDVCRSYGVSVEDQVPGVVAWDDCGSSAALCNGSIVLSTEDLSFCHAIASASGLATSPRELVERIWSLTCDPATTQERVSPQDFGRGSLAREMAGIILKHELIHSLDGHSATDVLPTQRSRWAKELLADRDTLELHLRGGGGAFAAGSLRIWSVLEQLAALAAGQEPLQVFPRFKVAFDQFQGIHAMMNHWKKSPAGAPTISKETWADFERLPTPPELLALCGELMDLSELFTSEVYLELPKMTELVLAPAPLDDQVVLSSFPIQKSLPPGAPGVTLAPCEDEAPMLKENCGVAMSSAQAALFLPAVQQLFATYEMQPHVIGYLSGHRGPFPSGTPDAAAYWLLSLYGESLNLTHLNQARALTAYIREDSAPPHRSQDAAAVRGLFSGGEFAQFEADEIEPFRSGLKAMEQLAGSG